MKKISTKLNICILTVTLLILTFVGSVTIINLNLDYRRSFEKTADSVLQSEKLSLAKDIDAVCEVLDSSMPLFSDSCEYYVLSGGNIIRSSAQGGMLEMTPELAKELGISQSGNSDALDRAQNINGYTVYIQDSKDELYDRILDITLLYLQALILGVALAAVISFFLSKRLTRSVKELEKGAKRMSEGEFSKIEVHSKDEIGSLCQVFNEMGSQIQSDYDEFERVENSRRDFVANVSHELKTPLTVIKSYSETLQNAQVDQKTQKQFLSVINSEVDRMTEMVSQLLVLSGLEASVTASTEDTDLLLLCQEIADTLLLEAKKKDLCFDIKGEGRIFTDRAKVKTILWNILSNAVKYSKEGGAVKISLTDKLVSIQNEGIPISSEDILHIFERFYRADKARSRETGGSGLGLAIAKECADSIGARLSATSTEDGVTEFILEFN